MNAPILRELASHEYLRERLAAEFPEADEETLQDTLEGLTDLNEMLAAVTRSFLDDRCLATALHGRIDAMKTRLSRMEATVDAKRRILATVMDRAGLRKLTEPDFTLSFRISPPALSVSDEGEIPDAFWKPQPAKLDRQALLLHLKSGQQVTGAALNNGAPSIAVRTK